MESLIDALEDGNLELPLLIILAVLLLAYAFVGQRRSWKAINAGIALCSSVLAVFNYLHLLIESYDILELLDETLPLTTLALLILFCAQAVFSFLYSKKVLIVYLLLHTLLLRLPPVIFPIDGIFTALIFGLFMGLGAVVVYALNIAGLIAADMVAYGKLQSARTGGERQEPPRYGP